MKKIISMLAILSLLISCACLSASAAVWRDENGMLTDGESYCVPGDGMWADDSLSGRMKSDSIKSDSSKIPFFIPDPEMEAIIAEKEAALYARESGVQTQAAAVFKRLAMVIQYPQENGYYCGPATARSIIRNVNGSPPTQATLAGNGYLQTNKWDSTPWCIGTGQSYSEYPMQVTLTALTPNFNYAPYPYGSFALDAAGLKTRVTTTIDQNKGVAISGTSYGTGASHLPGYPASTIGHWVACDGYDGSGNTIWIADPSKSSVISWSGSISAYQSCTLANITAFASSGGIIW